MSKSTQRYYVTFDLNGNAARYLLIAKQVENPFTPGILNQFRAPEKLL